MVETQVFMGKLGGIFQRRKSKNTSGGRKDIFFFFPSVFHVAIPQNGHKNGKIIRLPAPVGVF